jgi:outer membrane protein assembly factor BamB
VSFDGGRRIAYCACINGDLLALKPPPEAAILPPGSAGHVPVQLELAWRQHCGAPIFVAPAVLPAGAVTSETAVVVAAATGELTALTAAGAVLWRCSLDAGLYTPLLAVTAAGGAGGRGQGCTRLIAGSANGDLLCVDASNGTRQPYRVDLSSSRITGLVPIQARHSRQRLLCASSAEGGLFVVEPGALLAGGSTAAAVLDSARLPSEVFAMSAGPSQSSVLVGCRDEHVYCLRLG